MHVIEPSIFRCLSMYLRMKKRQSIKEIHKSFHAPPPIFFLRGGGGPQETDFDTGNPDKV